MQLVGSERSRYLFHVCAGPESASLLLLEVGDDVCSVLGVGNTGESHSVARRVVSRRLDVLVDGLLVPLRLAFEGAPENVRTNPSHGDNDWEK